MVLIVYVLPTTLVLSFALLHAIWIQVVSVHTPIIEVCWIFFFVNTSMMKVVTPHIFSESLRYLSMYDNRCLRYFKGHTERLVISNCLH